MSSAKSLAVAQRMLEACASDAASKSVTPMQLLKLVYIAHGYMLGRHGCPLLQEGVQAWRYGPVVPSLYHAVKGFNSSPVDKVPGAGYHAFSADEQAVIEDVARVYGRHPGVALSAATHRCGTPWSKTWERWGRNAAISNDLIESFYSDLLKQEHHSSL